MSRFILLAAVGIAMTTPVHAANEAAIATAMLRRVYRNDQGESLPYRLFVPPRLDPGMRYPLILFLHGAGERGDDNEAQLKHAEVLRLVDDDARTRYGGAFLVAPQCRSGHRWVEVPWGSKKPHKTPAEPSVPARLTLELLEQIERQQPIDPARRYVTGFSMGGYGTLDLIVRRPTYWAAGVVICGGADDARAADLAKTPIWILHGAADPAVPPARSQSLVKALDAANGTYRYTEYPGMGHNAWTRAYREPELVKWLYAQRRKDAGG